MPGKHITQLQENLYMKSRQTGCTQETAAAKAGFSVRSGHEKRTESLKQGILAAIERRDEDNKSNPLKININMTKPPLLVINVSGRLGNHEDAEKVIEDEVMSKLREDTRYYENNVRIVLDLRGLVACRTWAAEAIMYRWGRYLNYRCMNGKVAIVRPRDETPNSVLCESAYNLNLEGDFVVDLNWKVLSRVRDIDGFLH